MRPAARSDQAAPAIAAGGEAAARPSSPLTVRGFTGKPGRRHRHRYQGGERRGDRQGDRQEAGAKRRGTGTATASAATARIGAAARPVSVRSSGRQRIGSGSGGGIRAAGA